MIRSIESLTGQPMLERKYNDILNQNPTPSSIWSLIIKELKLGLNFDKNQLKKVPQAGPVVFIANHPFGVIDGICLGYLVSLVKPEFKFLVNEVLCREEVLNHFFLPVDFSPTKSAQQTNINTRKIAVEKLAEGEPIVIFPSGGVATAKGLMKRAEELEWKRFVVKLIKNSKACVVPMYFEGRNSLIFHLASQISMDLRLAFLLNEVRNKVGKTITIRIGNPINYDEIPDQTPEEMLGYLQKCVQSLRME